MSTQQTVFITGGASGLGFALASQYLQAGWQVAVGDRDAVALVRALDGELAGAFGMVCDVTLDADLERARDAVLARWGSIDLIYNNAGVALAGSLEDGLPGDWQWIIDTNLMGVVRGCRIFAPVLRAQGRGRLVNIASMAGMIHPPGMSAYCATKAAVVALSEVLEIELAGSGVGVSVVCPGFFRTALARHGRASSPVLRQVAERLVGGAAVSADAVATKIRAGVARGHFFILTHRLERGLWWLKRLLPHTWFVRLMIAGVDRMAARSA